MIITMALLTQKNGTVTLLLPTPVFLIFMEGFTSYHRAPTFLSRGEGANNSRGK